jgi:hypothetical protein
MVLSIPHDHPVCVKWTLIETDLYIIMIIRILMIVIYSTDEVTDADLRRQDLLKGKCKQMVEIRSFISRDRVFPVMDIHHHNADIVLNDWVYLKNRLIFIRQSVSVILGSWGHRSRPSLT